MRTRVVSAMVIVGTLGVLGLNIVSAQGVEEKTVPVNMRDAALSRVGRVHIPMRDESAQGPIASQLVRFSSSLNGHEWMVKSRGLQVPQQSVPGKSNWIKRHRARFGAMVGFAGGFVIGYLRGDDGIFPDTNKEFDGLVLGGVGALAGAIAGEATH